MRCRERAARRPVSFVNASAGLQPPEPDMEPALVFSEKMFEITSRNPFNLPSSFVASETTCNKAHLESAISYMKEVRNLYVSFSSVVETHQVDFLVRR
jgi:hypothetical protein